MSTNTFIIGGIMSIVVVVVIAIILGLYFGTNVFGNKSIVDTTTPSPTTTTFSPTQTPTYSTTTPAPITATTTTTPAPITDTTTTTPTPTPGPWQVSYSATDKNIVPLRIGSNGSIECMSTNGVNCFWGQNTVTSPSNLNPRNCGTNTSGWCNPNTLGAPIPTPAATTTTTTPAATTTTTTPAPTPGPWQVSYSATDKNIVPLRIGSNGYTECMSTDGVNCFWGQNTVTSPSNLNPRNCATVFENDKGGSKWCDPRTIGKPKPVFLKNGNGLYLTVGDNGTTVVQNTLLTDTTATSRQLWYINDDNTIQSVSTWKYINVSGGNPHSALYLDAAVNQYSYWTYNTTRNTIDNIYYKTIVGVASNSKDTGIGNVMLWEYIPITSQTWTQV